MIFKKLGLKIKPNKKLFWGKKYCMLPTPLQIKKKFLEYFILAEIKKINLI